MSGTGFDRVGLSTVMASGTRVKQLLAPSNNTRGIILRTVCLGNNGPDAEVAIFIGSAAPTDINDLTKIQIMRSGYRENSFSLTREILIPADNGIWAVMNSTNHTIYAWITYDEVPAK